MKLILLRTQAVAIKACSDINLSAGFFKDPKLRTVRFKVSNKSGKTYKKCCENARKLAEPYGAHNKQYQLLMEMAYAFPLMLYRFASDPDVYDTYGVTLAGHRGSEFGNSKDEILQHAVDIGLGLRVVLSALSDDKLLDVPSIVQLSVNTAQHLLKGVNLPLGLEARVFPCMVLYCIVLYCIVLYWY